jgi:hypothetical protein
MGFKLPPAAISHIPQNHPHELQHITASRIVQKHHASRFIPALTTFVRAHHYAIAPQAFDTFDLYKHIMIDLQIIPETSRHHCSDVVRATLPVPRRSRKPVEPGHFDFAPIRTDDQCPILVNAALSGTSV